MSVSSPTSARRKPSLAFVLWCAFLAILWLAGGASRSDLSGQIVSRLAAVIALILIVAFGPKPTLRPVAPLCWLIVAAVVLVILQLIPLPPSLWMALPGRALFNEAVTGLQQPWRPLSIVPSATINALVSLLIPIAALMLIVTMRAEERATIFPTLLLMIGASVLLGLFQITGVGFNNPLINDSRDLVSSSFANRNHFALLLAIGCLILPVWAFDNHRHPRGRSAIGLGASLVVVLTILATGSRAGIALGVLGFGIGLMLAQAGIRRQLRHAPKWVAPALAALVVSIVAGTVVASIAADRAVSIQRLLDTDTGFDMRRRGLPTVWAMIRDYFPVGAGLGTFDPVFRIHEPFALLKPTYFNHAHNDFLEVVLDAGLPGLLLLTAGLAWWIGASVRVWRGAANTRNMLPRLGSAMLLLIIGASLFDYPARTPMIMALMMVAAAWLSEGRSRSDLVALPERGQHL